MSEKPSGVAGLMQRFRSTPDLAGVTPAATITDDTTTPPAPVAAAAETAWTQQDVLDLETSYRSCYTEEQTAAWTADRMEGIIGELKRLHRIV